MKLTIYGKKIKIVKTSGRWVAYYIGSEGKKRTAHDIIIPAELKEDETERYLEDFLNEWAH